MSELEKAKQEVEQVYFAYDKAGDTGDIKDWKGFYDLENKLIEKVKIANQPSLTIPKSIAERLINFIEINHGTDFIIEELLDFKNMERSHCFEPDLKLHDFLQNNTNICVLYLAGKALGVDLVKVGADEN